MFDKEFKNILTLSFVFFCAFAAYNGVQSLQTSLNQEEGLGIVSLCTLYGTIIVSGVLAPAFIKHIGVKTTFVLSWFVHVLYQGANFYPTWWTLVPASVLLGSISGFLWTAHGVYISTMAFSNAEAHGKTEHGVLSFYGGVFFSMYGISEVIGNLVSSLVFDRGAYNITGTSYCGAADCPLDQNATSIIERPSSELVYTLLSIFVASDIAGLILTVVLLPKLSKTTWSETVSVRSSLVAWFTSLFDWKMSLLIPWITYQAISVGVLITDFTKSYISCPFGIQMVGFIMASYGGSMALFSFVFSRVAKYTGRYVLFAVAIVTNLFLFLLIYHWTPQEGDIPYVFIIAVTWGVGEGIWQAQTNALIALLFIENKEPAFANYHTLKSIGYTTYFVMSYFLCVRTKLLIVLAWLGIAVLLYIVLEVTVKYKKEKSSDYSVDKSAPEGVELKPL